VKDPDKDRWEVDFSIELGDLVLKNPILAASGTYGYGKELNNNNSTVTYQNQI